MRRPTPVSKYKLYRENLTPDEVERVVCLAMSSGLIQVTQGGDITSQPPECVTREEGWRSGFAAGLAASIPEPGGEWKSMPRVPTEVMVDRAACRVVKEFGGEAIGWLDTIQLAYEELYDSAPERRDSSA